MAEERDIKYVNRTFADFRTQLIEFTKNYFPDTYNDFSPTSPGMMFMEMASYVGDVLSFYQDTQLQETFLQHARNPGNLYNLAYMMGYRPKVTSVAEVELEFTKEVNASGDSPDYASANTPVEQNSVVLASVFGNTQFLTSRKVDFSFSSSLDPTTVQVSEFNNDNTPNKFTLTKKVKAFSGRIKTITETVGTAEKFYTVNINDDNIIGVLSITDTIGDTWYEVPFLGQETIFVESRNNNSDSGTVYNNLTLQKVPKRFVTRFNSNGQLQIQFGSGTKGTDDSTFVPTLENVGLGTSAGIPRLDYAYDPSNFLYTRTYGLAPSNTTLTINYLVGGGTGANVPANTINSLQNAIPEVTVTNPLAATGGSDGDTVDDLRQNSLRAFSEQGRAVTLADYNVRALSLSPSLGSIAKVYTTQDELYSTNSTTDLILDSNPLALSMYVLSYDINGKLTAATSTLKGNLKTYLSQYIMLTDALNIKDAFVVNIGVDFEIILLPNTVARDVLLTCSNKLKDYFSTSKRDINQPINLSKLYTLLDRVKGVQTVQKIEITNKVGGNYSQYGYDIKGATKNNIVYPSLDPCIFEVKFPDTDIRGKVVTN